MSLNPLESFPAFAKHLFFTIIVFIGVVSGILIGYQLISKKQASALSTEVSGISDVPDNMRLKFGQGDLFPEVFFFAADSTKCDLRATFRGKKCAVIFAELECVPCQDFFEQWNQIVTQNLKEGVQELVVISKEQISINGQLPEALEGMSVRILDLEEFKKVQNLVIFPTVVTIDEQGIVRHIQYGLRGGIDYEILKFLTTHDI
ncbi:MAG: hypothetical protein ACREBV_02400 [Candidatus Zixiibacteriota bacterium]